MKELGYTNIDGLDPSSGLLAAAQEKGLYQRTICGYVTPDTPTDIQDNTYNVLLCSAGMFPGSIVPQVPVLSSFLSSFSSFSFFSSCSSFSSSSSFILDSSSFSYFSPSSSNLVFSSSSSSNFPP